MHEEEARLEARAEGAAQVEHAVPRPERAEHARLVGHVLVALVALVVHRHAHDRLARCLGEAVEGLVEAGVEAVLHRALGVVEGLESTRGQLRRDAACALVRVRARARVRVRIRVRVRVRVRVGVS